MTTRRIPHPQGWVPLEEAASRMGKHPSTLRRDIAEGSFTRLRKSTGKTTDLYVPEAEVAAFERGGIDAVIAMRTVAPASAGA